MLHDILDITRNNPTIVLFLALAIGYFVGKRLKIFGVTLGTTASVLLAALAVGQVGIEIPAIVKSVSFALFIFCVGYKVGPQFFGALKKEGIHYLWISLVVAFTALATTIAIGKIMHLDKGTTAGMFSGAVTTSAALGTSTGAIEHQSISDADKKQLDSNMAVAYAITYIFGTAGTIVVLKMVPKFWKMDLRAEARKLEAQMGGRPGGSSGMEVFSWTKRLDMRAYTANKDAIIGKTVSQVEALFPDKVAIDKIKRGQNLILCEPDTTVASGDILLVLGQTAPLIKAEEVVGPEVDREKVVDMVGEVMDVCILNKEVVGKSLEQLSKLKNAHGVFLRSVIRQGHELPIIKGMTVHKCDVLKLVGTKDDVERAVKFLGYAERPTTVTDLATVAIGCVAGTLLGLIVIRVFGIPITLGAGGGILLIGLLCGWLRSLHPTFGQIPGGAQWILSDLGLNLFVACVGLSAGPEALQALKTTGLPVFFGGVMITLLPIIVVLFFGRKILKMNPVLLLGAVTGAHNCTASLNAIMEEADSPLPVLGYAAPYAFANVFLTVWGSVIINAV